MYGEYHRIYSCPITFWNKHGDRVMPTKHGKLTTLELLVRNRIKNQNVTKLIECGIGHIGGVSGHPYFDIVMRWKQHSHMWWIRTNLASRDSDHDGSTDRQLLGKEQFME
jgi:LEA14-like dessication related protein